MKAFVLLRFEKRLKSCGDTFETWAGVVFGTRGLSLMSHDEPMVEELPSRLDVLGLEHNSLPKRISIWFPRDSRWLGRNKVYLV